MLRSLSIFFCILSHFTSVFGGVGWIDLKTEKETSRHYFSVDQISVYEEGIIIFEEDVCLLANTVFQDEQGFYYLEEGVYWICRTCGALNDLDNKVCYSCGES